MSKNNKMIIGSLVALAIIGGIALAVNTRDNSTTATSTPDIVIATSTVDQLATTTTPVSGAPTTKKYTDNAAGFSVVYPAYLTRKENTALLNFPTSFFVSTSIRDGYIGLLATKNLCASSSDGLYSFKPAKTVVRGGHTFSVTYVNEGATGNFYRDTEYATQKGDTCYRITLHEHSVSTGAMFGNDATQIARVEKQDKLVRASMVAILDAVARSFTFTK